MPHTSKTGDDDQAFGWGGPKKGVELTDIALPVADQAALVDAESHQDRHRDLADHPQQPDHRADDQIATLVAQRRRQQLPPRGRILRVDGRCRKPVQGGRFSTHSAGIIPRPWCERREQLGHTVLRAADDRLVGGDHHWPLQQLFVFDEQLDDLVVGGGVVVGQPQLLPPGVRRVQNHGDRTADPRQAQTGSGSQTSSQPLVRQDLLQPASGSSGPHGKIPWWEPARLLHRKRPAALTMPAFQPVSG